MGQCKAELRCQCPDWESSEGATCATTAFCLREKGHPGKHRWERHHECWHGHDAWCEMPYPKGAANRAGRLQAALDAKEAECEGLRAGLKSELELIEHITNLQAALDAARALAHDWQEAYSEEFFRPFTAEDTDVSRDRVAAAMGRHMAKILLAIIGGAEGEK